MSGVAMREFVDLVGASGASYRFKHLPKTVTPLRMAGNFVVVKERAGAVNVVHVAETNDLSKVHEICSGEGLRGTTYIRLNVARVARESEHEDLVAKYGAKQLVAAE